MGANGDVALVPASAPPSALSAWRFVTVFRAVGPLADVVKGEGPFDHRPVVISLGATGLVVGAVTGVEAAALGLRLRQPLADRSRRF